MKIISLKQVLHWLFLAVGIFSVFMLSFSASTYMNYAKGGYGLDISISGAWLYHGEHNDTWLVIKLNIKNPGGLDMGLVGGNVTLGQTYAIPHTILPNGQPQNKPLAELPKGENTPTIIWIPIGSDDLNSINVTGQTDILMDLIIDIPARYAQTHLICQANNMEVRPPSQT
jgi:hypothetical protein